MKTYALHKNFSWSCIPNFCQLHIFLEIKRTYLEYTLYIHSSYFQIMSLIFRFPQKQTFIHHFLKNYKLNNERCYHLMTESFAPGGKQPLWPLMSLFELVWLPPGPFLFFRPWVIFWDPLRFALWSIGGQQSHPGSQAPIHSAGSVLRFWWHPLLLNLRLIRLTGRVFAARNDGHQHYLEQVHLHRRGIATLVRQGAPEQASQDCPEQGIRDLQAL